MIVNTVLHSDQCVSYPYRYPDCVIRLATLENPFANNGSTHTSSQVVTANHLGYQQGYRLQMDLESALCNIA